MLQELMHELEAAPASTLMVGDTSHDLGMAAAAGVDAVAVAYGAHGEDDLRALQPLACVSSIEELSQWLTMHG
jgi:phosphoglycolate phosphatase